MRRERERERPVEWIGQGLIRRALESTYYNILQRTASHCNDKGTEKRERKERDLQVISVSKDHIKNQVRAPPPEGTAVCISAELTHCNPLQPTTTIRANEREKERERERDL